MAGRYIGSSLSLSCWVADTFFHLAPVAFGSVDESPTTGFSSPSDFASYSRTPKTRLDIRKLFRNSPSSPPVIPFADPDLSSPPVSATLSTSTLYTQSAHPPSPKSFQDSTSPNPRKGFPSDVLLTKPRSPADLTGGTIGSVGVGSRPPPISRKPDGSLLTPALQEALNLSITSGRFADTKIYLFSHRNAEGDICKPKALYANSVVLKTVPYFNDCASSPDHYQTRCAH